MTAGLLPLPGFQPVDKPPNMDPIMEGQPVAPEVLAEARAEEEAPRTGRKSLSLTRLGKAALRRCASQQSCQHASIIPNIAALSFNFEKLLMQNLIF